VVDLRKSKRKDQVRTVNGKQENGRFYRQRMEYFVRVCCMSWESSWRIMWVCAVWSMVGNFVKD
jgi:hypothetical protein